MEIILWQVRARVIDVMHFGQLALTKCRVRNTKYCSNTATDQ